MNLNRLHGFVFWFFFAGFLATASTVLFFTLGYRFSFERGIFIYTGSITVKSDPRTVEATLDGEPIPTGMIHDINQALHITGVTPGEHLLRIEADGFLPWEKSVIVQSGLSTEFWNVLLSRSSYVPETVIEGNFEQAFHSSTRRYIALVGERDNETTVTLLERQTQVSKEIFSVPEYRFAPEDGLNIEWSKDENALLVPLRSRDGNDRAVFLINLKAGSATDLRDIVAVADPRNPRWHPDNDGTFFVLSEGSLVRIVPDGTRPESRAVTVAERVSAYDLSGRFIAVLDSGSGTVSELPLTATRETEPEPITQPIPTVTGYRDPVLTLYDEKRIAIHDRGQEGLLWNDAGELEPSVIPMGTDIRGIQFSDDGKKLLVFTGHEISVIFTRDWDVQPARKAGEILQVVRFSSELSEVRWEKSYEHVLFVAEGGLKMAELDNRGRRNIGTILPDSGNPIRQIITFPADDELHILSGRPDNGTTALSFIRFPEPIGFFER